MTDNLTYVSDFFIKNKKVKQISCHYCVNYHHHKMSTFILLSNLTVKW